MWIHRAGYGLEADMPYVMMTAHYDWAGQDAGERRALMLLNRWAERLDDLDGQATRPRWPEQGGLIRQIRVAPVRAGGTIAHAVLTACTSARMLARHGQVGIAYGHGSAGVGAEDAWVDLVPGGRLRVDYSWLQAYGEQVAAGTAAPRGLTDEEQLFDLMGQALREYGSVRRVDFYTCSIGASERGQRVLDAIHYFWRLPLRGLRGPLRIDGNPINSSVIPRVQVLPPRGTLPRRHSFNRYFVDSLITDRSLWTLSHNRRPDPIGRR